ncbi:SMC-Scp complex subunit ScpB [Candidatus Falkowbacteria bacterium]|nr:SMC-Scp complex subunit ScpB [Candidatus Falkowbacteria bacterium]
MSILKSQLESLLFISAKPLSIKKMSDVLRAKENEIKIAADELVKEYKDKQGGMLIIKNNTQYQMSTHPDNAKLIQEFIKDETTGELTRPSLETLTVIAYRGPIAKVDLEQIRGVNCSLILRNLMIRGLIEAREDKQKKQIYYNITFEFMKFLGITDVRELPDYEKLSKDPTLEQVLEISNENRG